MRLAGAADASDAELVDAVRTGDLPAFEVLYKRHLAGVRAAVRDQIRDAHDAAEVVQETFARALGALAGLQSAERFRPWLLSIARHTGPRPVPFAMWHVLQARSLNRLSSARSRRGRAGLRS